MNRILLLKALQDRGTLCFKKKTTPSTLDDPGFVGELNNIFLRFETQTEEGFKAGDLPTHNILADMHERSHWAKWQLNSRKHGQKRVTSAW